MTPSQPQWERSVGFLPHKVTVYEELSRQGTLYLRWRQGGNWKRKSLRRPLRTTRGVIDKEVEKWALDQANAQYAALVKGLTAEERAPIAPLTLAQGLAKAIDPGAGKYPTDTLHRREVIREMNRAMDHWGKDTPWDAIKRAHLRQLWRHRILTLRAEGDTGIRGAEITLSRVLAIAAWLRDEELIPAGACVAPKKWRQELRNDWLELSKERSVPEPSRPRHTLEEMRRIIAKAGEVDPRLELALVLGAELRPGQVLRARRSDIDLHHETFTVHGKGHKRGEVVKLTAGQIAVIRRVLTEGYLRELEANAPDYSLFPRGQLAGGRKMEDPRATVERHKNAAPLDRSAMDNWFNEAEKLAGVPHISGRGFYGLKRQSVDAAKAAGISREGLQRLGGWTDTQMPDRVYADQQADYAREEAMRIRAKIRGEAE